MTTASTPPPPTRTTRTMTTSTTGRASMSPHPRASPARPTNYYPRGAPRSPRWVPCPYPRGGPRSPRWR
eukprot:scaffold8925_cov15-Phaeocystis_antarctica.AAC.1